MRNAVALLFAACIGLQGCALFQIARSPERENPLRLVETPGGVRIASVGAVDIYVFLLIDHVDFIPGGARIEVAGKIIYVDPIVVEDPIPADYILITHSHGDHLSLADIERITVDRTIILCPRTVAKSLAGRPSRIVKPGEESRFEGLTIRATHSYNLKSPAHPRKDENVGYILEAGGATIYCAGDTDFVPELRDIRGVDAALVPIDGGTTMGPEEAASLINAIEPKIALPVHYALGSPNLDIFLNLVDPGIRVELLHGAR